jgi:type I restriction enzyme S subunit
MTMSLLVEHFDDLLATPKDVELLNRAILQLAVQGKLVLQDSQDESAEILYKRILKEKEQNLNGRTPRSLPSISQDEIPFEVPSNWVWTRLGEISNYGEATKSKAVEFTDETWVLDLEDIEKTTSRLIQRVRLKDRQFQSEKSVFQKGDVIYGKLRPYLDKVIVADEDGICSSELIPIKTYGNINPYYLRLALKRPDFIDYVNGKTYGVKMPRLGTQDARMALIPLPPLAEQQRIVARVEELFVQTRALAKELAHSQIELDGLSKSVLSHLLASETPEEFNQHWDFIAEHFDLLFQAPEHVAPLRQSILELAVRGKLTRREAGDECAWEEKELRDIAEIIDCLHITPTYAEHGFPMVRATEIKSGFLDISNARKVDEKTFKEFSKKHIPKIGDVVLCRVGATYGTSSLVNSNEPFCLGQNTVFLVPKMSPNYFYYFLNSPNAKGQMGKLVSGSAQPTISLKSLGDLIVPVPSLAEQERIVKRVEQLLSLCDALEARLQSAEEERGRLVAAVMAGVGGRDG